jgi:Rha family phage regulatory protein
MTNLALATPSVSIVNNHSVTTIFHKRHDDVLRAIRKRVVEAGNWGVRNFTETPYIDEQNGQTYAMFTLTKDGFTFLVQKFTGKKAVQYQVAYIEQFNAMEAALINSAAPQLKLPITLTPAQLHLAAQLEENRFRISHGTAQAHNVRTRPPG